MVPDSTPLFAALAAWRVDLTGPGFILPAYLLVNLLAGAGIWRLLGAGLGLPGGLPRAALLFALAFADFKLVGFNKSSWLGEHNFSFTFVAVALRIWVLAALFEARYARAAALVVLVNLLSFKVGWPLVGFLALLALPQGLGGWRVWLLLALSLVWPGLAALHSAHLAPGEAGLV